MGAKKQTALLWLALVGGGLFVMTQAKKRGYTRQPLLTQQPWKTWTDKDGWTFWRRAAAPYATEVYTKPGERYYATTFKDGRKIFVDSLSTLSVAKLAATNAALADKMQLQ